MRKEKNPNIINHERFKPCSPISIPTFWPFVLLMQMMDIFLGQSWKRKEIHVNFLSFPFTQLVLDIKVTCKEIPYIFLSWKALLSFNYLPLILVHLTCTSSVLPQVSPVHTSDVIGSNADPPRDYVCSMIFRKYTFNGKYQNKLTIAIKTTST